MLGSGTIQLVGNCFLGITRDWNILSIKGVHSLWHCRGREMPALPDNRSWIKVRTQRNRPPFMPPTTPHHAISPVQHPVTQPHQQMSISFSYRWDDLWLALSIMRPAPLLSPYRSRDCGRFEVANLTAALSAGKSKKEGEKGSQPPTQQTRFIPVCLPRWVSAQSNLQTHARLLLIMRGGIAFIRWHRKNEASQELYREPEKERGRPKERDNPLGRFPLPSHQWLQCADYWS